MDVATRSILRLILGSIKSTPTEILYSDLGIEPTKIRMSWLAARYVIKLGNKPLNSTYKLIQPHLPNPKALEASYHHDTTPEEVYIFSDSRAALLAINATSKDSQNPALLDIWDTVSHHRLTG
ncbi:hypothetical protein OUZ56_021254 [Daphnia magna]|uniref:Reverse transcriptase RNase H-like domain-containing protein n=1 Tax=Daphnia magna TaxID=35525 RepID=A0ABQ9ZGV9_9CRUS|nr:hypothetical protein OUZ56_021254 [Daphnia magna]